MLLPPTSHLSTDRSSLAKLHHRMSDLLCTELSTLPAVCTDLHEDDRRLQILLDQEERFMPCASYPRMQTAADEEQRTRMLEVIYEVNSLVGCMQPSASVGQCLRS